MELSKKTEYLLALKLQLDRHHLNLITSSATLLDYKFLSNFEDILKKHFSENTIQPKYIEENKNKMEDMFVEVTKDIFPEIVLGAIFSNCYNIFENQLTFMCNKLSEESKLDLSLNDLNDKGYKRIKVYFQKVIKLPIDKDIKDLSDRIFDYSEIRNIILHRNGELKGSKLINKKWIVNYFIDPNKEHIKISTRSIQLANNDYTAFYKYLFDNLYPNVKKEYPDLFTT